MSRYRQQDYQGQAIFLFCYFFKFNFCFFFCKEAYFYAGAQLGGGRGGGLPRPFLKTKKSALILELNALIVSILRLNSPFKMRF